MGGWWIFQNRNISIFNDNHIEWASDPSRCRVDLKWHTNETEFSIFYMAQIPHTTAETFSILTLISRNYPGWLREDSNYTRIYSHLLKFTEQLQSSINLCGIALDGLFSYILVILYVVSKGRHYLCLFI